MLITVIIVINAKYSNNSNSNITATGDGEDIKFTFATIERKEHIEQELRDKKTSKRNKIFLRNALKTQGRGGERRGQTLLYCTADNR